MTLSQSHHFGHPSHFLTETGRREGFVRSDRRQLGRIKTNIVPHWKLNKSPFPTMRSASFIGSRLAPRIRGGALKRQWSAMVNRSVAFPVLTNTAAVHHLVHTLHQGLKALDTMLPGCGIGSNGAPHPQNAIASDRRTTIRLRTRHRAKSDTTTNKYLHLLTFSVYRISIFHWFSQSKLGPSQ